MALVSIGRPYCGPRVPQIALQGMTCRSPRYHGRQDLFFLALCEQVEEQIDDERIVALSIKALLGRRCVPRGPCLPMMNGSQLSVRSPRSARLHPGR